MQTKQWACQRPQTAFTPARLAVGFALCTGFSQAVLAHNPPTPPAPARATSEQQQFSIAAGPLASALRSAASSANILLTFTEQQTAGKTTAGLQGAYTPQAALQALLSGSGLQAIQHGHGVYVLSEVTPASALPAADSPQFALDEVRVLASAEEELRQAPGVSIITRTDLEQRPPANDLSELIRTMPGVNLTGSSSTGQFGNNRQIDLRGMGPDNTLILIDGVAVSSRNATRMGRSGERNTRGDSNWVPAEAVERIEILRGPAAARYGSGAAGGVVNIITRQPTKALSGSLTAYLNRPESGDEQDTRRLAVNLAGPLSEHWSFRLYASANRTEADSTDLNAQFATGVTPPAGREGVRNRDINALLRWDLSAQQTLEFKTGFSRQGNIYAGDRALNFSSPLTSELAAAGAETNTLYRRTAALTHRGKWGKGQSSRLNFSYEGTLNHRMNEGLSGGQEGSITQNRQASQNQLHNWQLDGEWITPLRLGGVPQILTLGMDLKQERLDDPYAMTLSNPAAGFAAGRTSRADARSWALYLEDNLQLTPQWVLTPGLRFDQHDQFGKNLSPSLNANYQLTSALTFKGGIARAFKAPNLYQSNPHYLWQTNGNGCPVNWPRPGAAGCLIVGNPELKPETSVNKEIGIAYEQQAWTGSLTYFHNDYDNKVVADMPDQAPDLIGNSYLFRWVNASKAIVRGIEGSFSMPFSEYRLKWSNNLTYMLDNKNKLTGQSLAVVPDYTVNSTLEWQASEQLSAMLTATFYGEQAPRTRTVSGSPATGTALNVRPAYHLVGANASYRLSPHWRLLGGVNNLFDKRLYREHNQAAAGAATYNEAGRAFYATLSATF